MDGVICGHIHHPVIRKFDDNLLYVNCGDWVESCTAAVEHFDGQLEIIEWIKSEAPGNAVSRNSSAEHQRPLSSAECECLPRSSDPRRPLSFA